MIISFGSVYNLLYTDEFDGGREILFSDGNIVKDSPSSLHSNFI